MTDAPDMNTSYSSAWVGIGGFFTSSSESNVYNDLIQLGTEQDASSRGATQYYAWYEMLPSSETVISKFTIKPGDTITASLEETGTVTVGSGKNQKTEQAWILSMRDGSEQWSTTVDYDSSLSSAEWIMEAPYDNGILPLADYKLATFNPCLANGAAGLNTGVQGVDMVDPHGQTSTVGSPVSDNDFTATWGTDASTSPHYGPYR